MSQTNGVYVMRVASMLTGMHPQTLRKYERAGLLSPSRSKTLRMYSDEDIARLKVIKRLVDEVGLNLAGVELALKLQTATLNIKEELSLADTSSRPRDRLVKSLDKMLEMLGETSTTNKGEYAYSGKDENKKTSSVGGR